MNTEKTHWAWYRIAFKRAARGLPALDLSRLDKNDIRILWYLLGQSLGKQSKGEKL